MTDKEKSPRKIAFKADTQQLLNILINSLYSDRDVFLRELISNASDAMTKLDFIMLTDRNVIDPDAAMQIRIHLDKDAHTLRIVDSGIGMNAEELKENLGTIAQSGARKFLEAAEGQNASKINDLIGQFGVGFYAAFMAADSVEVTSRSYRPEDTAAVWHSDGAGTFSVSDAEKTSRGTEVLVKLKENAYEYCDEAKIREIVKKHSNYIPYPIFLNEEEEQLNDGDTIWRKSASEVTDEDYNNFYQKFTMDFVPPINRLHLNIDAPVQMYGLLYVPSSPEKNMWSLRKEDGLRLFARKVLIQDYCKDLLPRYYRFIEGVVDSEDIPLNVSRETMQANRIILTLKKILTGKVTDMLKNWGSNDPEKYTEFWKKFGYFLCEGVITEPEAKDNLIPLLRFRSMNHGEEYHSLADYVLEMKPDQKKIYYVLGENIETLRVSPHTELLRQKGYDVLLLTESYDPFVITAIQKFQDFDVVNAASDKADAEPEKKDEEAKEETQNDDPAEKDLIQRFKDALGDEVSDVRTTDKLVSSPARLVAGEGAIPQEMEKIYFAMKEDYVSPKKVLEINPKNPLVAKLADCKDQETASQIIRQIYDGARIMDGDDTNQAAMLERVQSIMLKLLEK